MAATKKSAPTIMDVAHPGKSAPTGNSKSVIITKHTVVQDPMVVPDAVETAPKLSSPSVQKKVIQPLSAPEPITEKPVEPQPAVAEPTIEAPIEKPIEEPVAITKQPEPTAAQQPSNADAGDKGPVNEEAQEAAEEETLKKHESQVQKLIDTKQYYLPITSSEQRRTRRTVVIGLLVSVILAAAWLNIALDAGIIQIDGVQSLTHFFSS